MKKQLLSLFAACIVACSSYSQAPAISSFSPVGGPVGTLVNITGTNLLNPTAFTIGGVPAIVVSDNGTTLVGMVMPGATTGSVSVTTTGGAATGNVFTVMPTLYPSIQLDNKLVGSGYSGAPKQGGSVAISADGNTAIVGGMNDSFTTGAAWVYIRSGGTWTQQGSKLRGTGATAVALQGTSVALSADGNTAIVGAQGDSSGRGAAWVYTRTAGLWSQQGLKLVGSGSVGVSGQGISVSLSADGNTALVGGNSDSSHNGAAWVFVRTGGTWSQQGTKLRAADATYGMHGAQQGFAVSLSADGNTAIVGGYWDNGQAGAAWIYTRSGTVWTQQGAKLVGTGAVNGAQGALQGTAVALSADGNTAMVGALGDSSNSGAAWVYTRTGGSWNQQGAKLTVNDAIYIGGYGAQLGTSISLSADGNTAIIGGSNDSLNAGASWIFTRSGGTWSQQGGKLKGTGATGRAGQGNAVSISADGGTAFSGGLYDHGSIGATWVFVRSCNPNSSMLSHSICQGDTFVLSNVAYTAPGTYLDTLANVGGCDSVVTLHLTVNQLPVVTFTQTDTIICTDCTSPAVLSLTGGSPRGGHYSGPFVVGDSIIIPIMTDSLFGVVYIYSDSNGCDASAAHLFHATIIEGVSGIEGRTVVHIYPDPNTGSFTLETSQQQGYTYIISDMLGQTVQQRTITSDKQIIDVKSVQSGIYSLSVAGSSRQTKFAVFK